MFPAAQSPFCRNPPPVPFILLASNQITSWTDPTSPNPSYLRFKKCRDNVLFPKYTLIAMAKQLTNNVSNYSNTQRLREYTSIASNWRRNSHHFMVIDGKRANVFFLCPVLLLFSAFSRSRPITSSLWLWDRSTSTPRTLESIPSVHFPIFFLNGVETSEKVFLPKMVKVLGVFYYQIRLGWSIFSSVSRNFFQTLIFLL